MQSGTKILETPHRDIPAGQAQGVGRGPWAVGGGRWAVGVAHEGLITSRAAYILES